MANRRISDNRGMTMTPLWRVAMALLCLGSGVWANAQTMPEAS